MHSIQLADLAAVLAIHGPALLFRRELVPEEALQAYWVAARQRCEVWHQHLGEFSRCEATHDPTQVLQWWSEYQHVIDEIFLAESLARMMAAIGAKLDDGRDAAEVSPITHSVYISQLEARNRALRVMLVTRAESQGAMARLNKLRSMAERWCDALLGHLWAECGAIIEPFGFDQSRLRAYGEDTAQLPRGICRDTSGWLLSAAIRDALAQCADPRIASGSDNRGVADAALLCLRPDLFDSVGVLKSLWLHRLERGAEQTDRVLHQLAGADITGADMLGGYEMIRGTSFGRW